MHTNHLLSAAVLSLTVALGACAQVPNLASLDSITLSPQTTGAVSLALVLPQTRAVQALPDGTTAVTISVTSSKLSAPVTQTITQSQFVNNRAVMQIDKLPAGDVQVNATIYDSKQNAIALGGATATVTAGQVVPISLNLVVKGATGGAAVTIDSKTVYDAPVVTIPTAIATQSFTLTAPAPYQAPSWTMATHLGAGQQINLAGSGRMGYGYVWNASYNYDYYDANGIGFVNHYGSLAPDQPALSVVARFVSDAGLATIFKVGTGCTFLAPSAGTLYLGTNTWQDSNQAFAGTYGVTLTSALR